jgi:hypothetical protein
MYRSGQLGKFADGIERIERAERHQGDSPARFDFVVRLQLEVPFLNLG